MHFFSSLISQFHIDNLRSDMQGQATTVDSLQRDLTQTQRELNKTMLAVEALVELLVERDALTRDEILTRMQEIDMRDGKLDGKVTPVAIACPSCHRPINPKLVKCYYCGTERPPGTSVVS